MHRADIGGIDVPDSMLHGGFTSPACTTNAMSKQIQASRPAKKILMLCKRFMLTLFHADNLAYR
jgi:hypothetical protein